MNLQRQRPWITPLVIGSFLLLTVTGVLMFFHLDSGLNKTAHEWLSWVMVAGVSTEEIRHRLEAQHIAVDNEQQSVSDIIGPDVRKQMSVLKGVLSPTAVPAAGS